MAATTAQLTPFCFLLILDWFVHIEGLKVPLFIHFSSIPFQWSFFILFQYTASQWISCNRFLYYWWHPLYLSSTPSQVLWMNHVCPCAVVSVSARSLTWLATLCFGGQTAGLQVGASTHFSACLAQTWGSAVAFVCSPDWPDDYCSPNGSSRDGCSPQGDQWGCWVLGLQRGWACLIGRGKSWKRFIEDTQGQGIQNHIQMDMIIIKYEHLAH